MPRDARQGRRWSDHRRVVDAVFHRIRTGTPWRDLPERFGPWQTAANRHRRWSADGTWERILAALQAGGDERGPWLIAIDSTIVRAHQHAAGARREPPRDVPADRLAPEPLSIPVHGRAPKGGPGS